MEYKTKVTPYLWFKNDIKEVIDYYSSIFEDMKVLNPYAVSETTIEDVQIATVEFLGEQFIFMNAGKHDEFNDAVSFEIDCNSQEEVDYYWEKLSENGGKTIECGWLNDKYGVRWQIIPRRLNELIADPDPVKKDKVVQAMLKMDKIIIEDLEKAYNNNDE